MPTHLIKPPNIMLDAAKLANTSDYGRFKLGAIIAQNKKIISMGTNSQKSHPIQQRFTSIPHLQAWRHAEIHSISLARVNDLIGSDIYVARILQDGTFANSRPCCGCMRALKHYGVCRAIYYDTGKFYREEI